MIELDYKIIKKFNKLFDEVAEFYGFEDEDISLGYNKCHIIKTKQLKLYSLDTVTNRNEALAVIKYVEGRYEYLAPFYKLFYGAFYNETLGIDSSYFREINESIKAVRRADII